MLCVLVLLVGCARDEEGQQTSVDRRAEQESIRAYFAGMAPCLTEKGFPATANPEGDGMSINVPVEQEADMRIIQAQCEQQIGPVPDPIPLTDDEIQRVYRGSLEVYDCLVANGYPAVEPPSLKTFVEQYRAASNDRGPWTPYASRDNPRVDPAAIEDCPEPDPFDR